MPVAEELAEFKPEKDTLLTVGVFDGVHLGHQYLFARLKEQAKKQDLLSVVVTFRQHPQELLSPDTSLPRLTDINEKAGLLKKEGVDIIATLPFTPELSRLSPRNFIALLKKHLRMRGMVIGPDFALGRDRAGDVEVLRALGRELGFSLTMVPPVKINGEVVSSTTIRKALASGDVTKMQRLTGRHFRLYGTVVPGVGRGRGLGFPTANLDVDSKQALPADGIYATIAYLGSNTCRSVTNIGKRPTFSGKDRAVEVYILDYSGDLYGYEMNIDFIKRLRGEQHFNSVEDLKKQIATDIRQGRTILAETRVNQG